MTGGSARVGLASGMGVNNPFGGKAFGNSMSLIDVLKRCRELSQASQDAIWSSTGVSEIVAILDRGIESLERGCELNRDELKLLFAPTGALQETSLDNGWSEDYLSLSGTFDGLIE